MTYDGWSSITGEPLFSNFSDSDAMAEKKWREMSGRLGSVVIRPHRKASRKRRAVGHALYNKVDNG